MPTKEEILKKKKYDYVMESVSNGFKDQKLSTPILSAMEEYAKQEALEYNIFYIDTKMKYLGWSFDNIWNEYQKSKLNK